MSLVSTFSSNPGNSPSLCLQISIEKISDTQKSLPPEYQDETIFHIKVLNAVKDVRACKLAYHKAAETVQDVISDLYASLVTMNENS